MKLIGLHHCRIGGVADGAETQETTSTTSSQFIRFASSATPQIIQFYIGRGR